MFIFKLVLSTYNHTKKVVEPKLKAKLVLLKSRYSYFYGGRIIME